MLGVGGDYNTGEFVAGNMCGMSKLRGVSIIRKWLRTRPSCLFFGTLLKRWSFPLYFTLRTRPSCIVHTTVRFRENLFLPFRYAPKRPSPFFLYIPIKTPFQRQSMNLLSYSCQQTGKKSANGKKLAYRRSPLPRLCKTFFHYCDTTFLWASKKCSEKYNRYCVG